MIAGTAEWESVTAARGMKRANEARKDERGQTRWVSKEERARQCWRRKAGMTVSIEAFLDEDERSVGVGKLVEWVKTEVAAGMERGEMRGAGPGRRTGCKQPQPVAPGRSSGQEQHATEEEAVTAWREGLEKIRARREAIGGDWVEDPREWARAKGLGVSVEELCAKLGISRARLTSLTKEYCGLSIGELVDGLRLKGLKGDLLGQLGEAARRVWGAPGDTGRLMAEGGKIASSSKYFSARMEREEPAIELAQRVEELLAGLELVRGDYEFEPEVFAVRRGFGSFAKMKRGCLNVFGKSWRQIERELAREVAEYYLAAEDRVLREIASRVETCEAVWRARELYHGSEELPVEPFCDRWSGAEFFKGGWLEQMKFNFGF